MTAISTYIAITSFVISAASAAYQVVQAKKQREKADAAAETRRGFEVPAEGNAGDAPLVYGRAIVGGLRTWHGATSEFKYVAPNANKSFLTGTGSRAAYTQSYTTYAGGMIGSLVEAVRQQTTRVIPGMESGYLNQSIVGSKNEFLFFQQAICVGPIHAVHDVVIDGGRYIDDPALGTYGYADDDKRSRIKAAMRIDCQYGDELVSDTIVGANFGERQSAVFDGMAYASCITRLDRTNPQFNGVPGLQFLIEGRLVRTVVAGVLQSTRIYSNNPAWCLLDYLLDEDVGKGISEEEINLFSFEDAAAIFGTIVQTNVPVAGKIYQPTDNARNVTSVDIPLYECNIILNPSKPVRENIEAILATAGDSRLVWSGGQYSLSAQYPASNEVIDLAQELTDDDLILDQDIEIAWPTASERLNHVTVRFHNEFEGFKEDSVSWPPKYTESYYKGIGGFRYGLPNGSWDETQPGCRLLNSYGVWDTDASDITLTYLLKVEPDQSGSYTLSFTGDDSMSIAIKETKTGGAEPIIYNGSRATWNKNLTTATIALGGASTKFYRIDIVAHDNGATTEKAMKGVGAKIESSSTVLWSTREPSYSDYVLVNYNSAVYDLMFAEDGNTELETSTFAEGITDPYHALAKAEEMVRTSRTAFNIKFQYKVKGQYLEPGDFIKLESETLGIGFGSNPLYIRVNSVKIDEKAVCELNGTRFDWTQLAWNVKDNVYVVPRSVYDSEIGLVSNIAYAPPIDVASPSSGLLTWTAAPGFDVAGYAIYAFNPETDPMDSLGQPIFTEIGRATGTIFTVPAINASSLFFGIRTVSLSGRMSDMVTLDVATATNLEHNWLQGLKIVLSDYGFTRRKSDLTVVPETITATAKTYNFSNPEYKWYIDGVVQAETSETLTIASFSDVRAKFIEVRVNELGGLKVQQAFAAVIYVENGADTASLVVTSDRKTINFDGSNNLNPLNQDILFSATKWNLDETPLVWTLKNLSGTPLTPGTYLSSTTGDSVTMTAANYKLASGSTGGVLVTASGHPAFNPGATVTGSASVTKVTNGIAEVTASLSRKFVNIPTDSDGLNEVFKDTNTVITVKEGEVNLEYRAIQSSSPIAGAWYVTADGGGIVTTGAVTDTGATATYSNIVAMSADAGRIQFTIIGKRLDGSDFKLVLEEGFLKIRGAIIDFTAPGPPSFGGTPLVFDKVVQPDGSVRVTATLTWVAPTVSATDLNYYEVGIRPAGVGTYVTSQTSGLKYSWIVVPGASYDFTVRAVDNSTNKGTYASLLAQTATGDTTIPAAPTLGASVTSIRVAFLKWTNAADADITSVQVFEASVDTGTAAPTIPGTALTTVNAVPAQGGGYSRSGILTGKDYYYWLKSVDSSGNVSPASVRIGPLASSTVAQDDFTSDSITANVLQSGSSLPAGLILGSTGFSLGSFASALADQAGTTVILPGRIQINGATMLSDWKNGGSSTEINGGVIAADTIKANTLQIGNRGIDITGMQFQAAVNGSGTPTGVVTWTAGTISYTNDAGVLTTVAISAGSATYASGILYIYWVKGATVLSSSNAMGTAYGATKIVLANYAGGVNLTVTYGRTIINGSEISAETITGDRIKANSVTADRIDSRGLSIKDASGNVIFASGTPLTYSNVTGGPPSNATNGAVFGVNIGGTFVPSTWIAAASITSAMIEELHATKIVAGTITADKIVGGAIAEMQTSPGQGGPHSISGSAGSTVDSTSLTVISTGGPHLINIYAEIGTTSASPSGCIIVLLCDGSEVGRAGIWCPGSWGAQGTSFPVVHTPGVGSHTYTVRCTTPGGGGSGPYTVNRSVIAYVEMKKTGV